MPDYLRVVVHVSVSCIYVIPEYADAVQDRYCESIRYVDSERLGGDHIGKHDSLVADGCRICYLLPVTLFVCDFDIELCNSLT